MNPRASRVKIPEDIHPMTRAAILINRLNDAIADDPRLKLLGDYATRVKREARDQRIIDKALANKKVVLT